MGTLIYLDYNATTPVDPRVVEACVPYLAEHFGNPSSTHAYGTAARSAVDEARTGVAGLIGAAPPEIVFTGGGSDSVTLAIRGAGDSRRATTAPRPPRHRPARRPARPGSIPDLGSTCSRSPATRCTPRKASAHCTSTLD